MVKMSSFSDTIKVNFSLLFCPMTVCPFTDTHILTEAINKGKLKMKILKKSSCLVLLSG